MNARCFLVAAVMLCAGALPTAAQSPYAGEETRAIASLSEADVAALKAGEGWGFAKAAELNGYPGPAHVLEAADALGLSAEQRADIEAIFADMRAEAQDLGARYVAAETTLSAAFERGDIDSETLATLVDDAGALRAELRRTHLAAHLRTTPLLTRHQRMIYARVRGYAAGAHGAHANHGAHD